jgi:ribose transport system permease protein
MTEKTQELIPNAGLRKRMTDKFPAAIKRIVRIDEIGILIGLLAICIALAIAAPTTFPRPTNLIMVVRQAANVGIIALGMVFVISMGDIDLSVGSIYSLVLIVTAWSMTKAGLNLAIGPAVIFGLFVGTLCGLINGLLSISLKLPTIIVTLGTMSIYRGFGLVICQATPITEFPKDNFFFNIIGGNIGPIPGMVIVWLVCAIILYIVYSLTPFGRRLCATGANLQAARFAGIQVTRIRLLGMSLMGFISAISGLTALAFLQASDPNMGTGYELFAIASAIIGGAVLSGGKGSIIGAIIGSLIIAVINNGVVILGINMYWNSTVTGVVIIAAVAIDYFIKRRNKTT